VTTELVVHARIEIEGKAEGMEATVDAAAALMPIWPGASRPCGPRRRPAAEHPISGTPESRTKPATKMEASPSTPDQEARSRMTKSNASDMTAEQKAALRAYALRNGRFWKRRLWAAWIDGSDAKEPEGAVLRQIRNTHGPSLLTRIGHSQLD
jgi:hypothetical protein